MISIFYLTFHGYMRALFVYLFTLDCAVLISPNKNETGLTSQENDHIHKMFWTLLKYCS